MKDRIRQIRNNTKQYKLESANSMLMKSAMEKLETGDVKDFKTKVINPYTRNKKKSEIKANLDMGKLLGFPDCCIKDYNFSKHRYLHQVISSRFTGFIPCENCSKSILQGNRQLKDLINKNRFLSTEFPVATKTWKETKHYLKLYRFRNRLLRVHRFELVQYPKLSVEEELDKLKKTGILPLQSYQFLKQEIKHKKQPKYVNVKWEESEMLRRAKNESYVKLLKTKHD